MAFLAPDIQVAVIKGTIPPTLTLDKLKKVTATSWREQRLLLGFAT
jgi:hypothetical protein